MDIIERDIVIGGQLTRDHFFPHEAPLFQTKPNEVIRALKDSEQIVWDQLKCGDYTLAVAHNGLLASQERLTLVNDNTAFFPKTRKTGRYLITPDQIFTEALLEWGDGRAVPSESSDRPFSWREYLESYRANTQTLYEEIYEILPQGLDIPDVRVEWLVTERGVVNPREMRVVNKVNNYWGQIPLCTWEFKNTKVNAERWM